MTLTGLGTSSIETAEDLAGRRVAVLTDSPGAEFARRYSARVRGVESLEQGYELLPDGAVDAVLFDRPKPAACGGSCAPGSGQRMNERRVALNSIPLAALARAMDRLPR